MENVSSAGADRVNQTALIVRIHLHLSGIGFVPGGTKEQTIGRVVGCSMGGRMLTESVHVRLSAAEKDAAKRLADRDGRPLSNWVRRLVIEQLRQELRRQQGQRHRESGS